VGRQRGTAVEQGDVFKERVVEPLLIVKHGNATEVARGADAFARFYLTEFYHDILDAFIGRRRRTYTLVAVMAALLTVLGLVPVFINSSSIFAIILMALSGVLFVSAVFCVVTIRRAPVYCKKHHTEFFETQIIAAKSPERRIAESRFYADHLEVLGSGASKGRYKKRAYHEISRVYETEDIYFFQGVGWVHKERLTEKEHEVLRAIITNSFGADRYIWVDVILG
jgi:hypothetical protein